MFQCDLCDENHERFKTYEGLITHLDRKHSDSIPMEMTVEQYAYYLKTGKTHGTCIMDKQPTGWNPRTGKYERLCSDKCRADYAELFKKRMVGKYGKTTLLNDPDHQKKMLKGRKISGTYVWSDGGKTDYTGSYEKDFLQFLDVLMNYESGDIMAPSPHTYYYMYEGKKHFYIPDFFIPSLNLEIEIKDGGNNANNHHKIQAVDKVKEKLKDSVMTSQSTFNYIKIVNKEYDTFFKFLTDSKDRFFNRRHIDKDVPIFIITESYNSNNLHSIVHEAGLALTIRSAKSIYKNSKIKPIQNGRFTEIQPQLLQIVNNCRTMDDINYLRRDLNRSKTFFKNYIEKIKETEKDPDNLKNSIMVDRIENGLTVEKVEAHLNWLNNVYAPAINRQANKIRSGVKEGNLELVLGNHLIHEFVINYIASNDVSSMFIQINDEYTDNGYCFADIRDINRFSEEFSEFMDELSQFIQEKGILGTIAEETLGDSAIRLLYIEPELSLESTMTTDTKIYHLSESNLDGKTLSPRVPSNFLTAKGYEENKTGRVCFSTNIDGALFAMSSNCSNKEFYVHTPVGKHEIYIPTVNEVPDCKITHEVWIKENVSLECIGKIRVTGDGEDKDYTYGDDLTATLCGWTWKWISHEPVVERFETRLSRPLLGKDVLLYHGSNKNLDLILPQSGNKGTRFSHARTSSFWSTDREIAIIFAIFQTIWENGFGRDISLDLTNKVVLVTDDAYDDINSSLKKSTAYVYSKNMPTKEVGRGHDPSTNEFTLDLPVKPDKTEVLYHKDMVKYLVKSTDKVLTEKDRYKSGDVYKSGGTVLDKIVYRSFDGARAQREQIKKTYLTVNESMTAAERKEIKTEDFGIPELRKYPLHDIKHVHSAIKLFNRVDPEHEAELAEHILAKIDEYGMKGEVIGTIGKKNRFKKYFDEFVTESYDEFFSEADPSYVPNMEKLENKTVKEDFEMETIDFSNDLESFDMDFFDEFLPEEVVMESIEFINRVEKTETGRVIRLNEGEKEYGLETLAKNLSLDCYLTSDIHVGFFTQDDIDRAESILVGINSTVGKDDHLIIAGDLNDKTKGSIEDLTKFIKRINCKNLYLILGNNDMFSIETYKNMGFKTVCSRFDGEDVSITHFPEKVSGNVVNIHGHIHGTRKYDNGEGIDDNHIDCWCGCSDFKPLTIRQSYERMINGLYKNV